MKQIKTSALFQISGGNWDVITSLAPPPRAINDEVEITTKPICILLPENEPLNLEAYSEPSFTPYQGEVLSRRI
jgi:hypothetical protein